MHLLFTTAQVSAKKRAFLVRRKALFKLSNTIPPGYSLVMTIVMTTYDKAENFMLVFLFFELCLFTALFLFYGHKGIELYAAGKTKNKNY
jgi:hypothetical protein